MRRAACLSVTPSLASMLALGCLVLASMLG